MSICPNPSKREMDMLYTTGEQTSVALAAMAINELGVPAVSLNAFQVAMKTTAVYGNARLKRIDTERIRYELSNNKDCSCTGFQGINQYNVIQHLDAEVPIQRQLRLQQRLMQMRVRYILMLTEYILLTLVLLRMHVRWMKLHMMRCLSLQALAPVCFITVR